MGEAKPFENTTISAPHGAPVRVRNRDDGGGGGIRTHGTLSRTPVFKTGAFDHSATPPGGPFAQRYCGMCDSETRAGTGSAQGVFS